MVQACFVHSCPIGRKSCKEKVSLFKCPNDERMLQKWRKFVPQKYRQLMSTDRICEKHFESKYVTPRFQQVKGDYYQDFIRPKLSPYAVPTIFADSDRTVAKPSFGNLPSIVAKPSVGNFKAIVAKPSVGNIPSIIAKKCVTPSTDESETLTSLLEKEIAKGVEVSDKEYISVCFNCLIGKCYSHCILVE